MKKHISAVKAMFIWAVGTLLAIIGAAIVGWQLMQRSPNISFIYGLASLLAGLIVIVINQVVFDVRKTQLDIDYQESIRDKIGNVCPNCGQRQPENSKFCNNCGNNMR